MLYTWENFESEIPTAKKIVFWPGKKFEIEYDIHEDCVELADTDVGYMVYGVKDKHGQLAFGPWEKDENGKWDMPIARAVETGYFEIRDSEGNVLDSYSETSEKDYRRISKDGIPAHLIK